MRETTEIPRENWDLYLNALSNRCKNLPVNVRLEGQDIGDQVLAEHMPLVGISLEKKGSEKDALSITVANQPTESLTHMVEHPEHIFVRESENGQVEVIDIEGANRIKTLIFFEEFTELPAGRS